MLTKIWKDPVFSKVIAVAIVGAVAYTYDHFSARDYLSKFVTVPLWSIAIGVVVLIISLIFAIWGKGIRTKENDMDFGGRNGQLTLDSGICDFNFNIITDSLIDYKLKCKKCNLRMEPLSTATYNFIPRFKFVCTECGNESKEFDMSLDDFFKEIEKRAERLLHSNRE